MTQAVRLVCQWAFNSEGVVVVAWLGPTSPSLRTVVHHAGFRVHPLPWRAATQESGVAHDAWYADLAAGDPTEPTGTTLTAREQHVLAHMARGRSNAEIAERLGISQNTVKNHVRSVLEQLQAPSRTAAVVLALQAGLVSLDGPSTLPPP
jgi:DNA-binding CsgD family transcriptional regulator